MAVSFNNQSISFKLKEKTKLKQWIRSITEKEKHLLGTINYIFCTDDELLEINIRHLNHNTLTDIITFDYTEGKTINSDIFISIDRVTENAKKFDVTFENELHRVMIHGVLHLCGYKDKTKADAELMRKKENASLKLFSNYFFCSQISRISADRTNRKLKKICNSLRDTF